MSASVNFKKTFVSADDWGFSPATNRGILSLAELGVVRRVSMLSTFAHIHEDLEALKKIEGLSLGLHFNLTDLEVRRSPKSILSEWTFGGRKAKVFVRKNFETQLQAFFDLGLKPKHLDGHEHLHLLPGFLKDVAELCKSAGIQTIRLPIDWDLLARVQAPILPLSLMAARTIRKHGFESLSFKYPARKVFESRERLQNYLHKYEGHEILTHPATAIDAVLEVYDRRFLDERVLQYEALKDLADKVGTA